MVGEKMFRKKLYLLVMCVLVTSANSQLIKASAVQNQEAVKEECSIVSTSTVDDQIYLFVKSPKAEMEKVNYQIGTSLCDKTKVEPINELNPAMKTLVLVDNSFSISQANRSKIKSMLLELISEKKDNELVRIATFNDQVQYLTDYISDYTELKKVIQCLQYKDQETYLTDVLYSILDTDFKEEQESYNRIIIISDGVDNKALGYTKDELYTKVQEKSIPIYTFGCSDGHNNEQLKNLFAISRFSKATYFEMNQIKDTAVPVAEMAKDRQIIRLCVTPQADLMDGSTKNSKLTFTVDGKEYALTEDVLMPFKVKVEEKNTEVTQPKEEAEEEKAEPVKENHQYIYIIVIGGVAIVGIIGTVIFMLLRKRKNQRAFEAVSNEAVPEYEEDDFEEPTEIAVQDEEKTCRIWNEPMRKTLILTDLNAPAKTFQVPLIDSVIIGRSSKNANLVIDYDRSISAKHCEIQVRPGNKMYMIDLGSSNGTFVNGNRVLTEVEIASGMIIKLGRIEFKLEVR